MRELLVVPLTPAGGASTLAVVVALLTMMFFLLPNQPLAEVIVTVPRVASLHVAEGTLVPVGAVTVTVHGL
jgi:hypothetical protein